MLLNITNATVSQVLVLSKPVGEIYSCRAVGSPLPLEITWRAQENGSSSNLRLSNEIDGVLITGSIDGSETVSTLQLHFNSNFHLPFCTLTNSASNGVLRNSEFLSMDPIIGMYVIIQLWQVGHLIHAQSCKVTAFIMFLSSIFKYHWCNSTC